MTLMLATAALGHVNPITVDSDWGADINTSPVTSAARQLTVPAGNPGTIKFTNVSQDGASFQYSKNGGAYSNVTEGGTVSVATTNTITFRHTGSSGTGSAVTVVDNTTLTTIGTWTGTVL